MKDGPQSVCGLDELTPPVSHLGDDLIQVSNAAVVVSRQFASLLSAFLSVVA